MIIALVTTQFSSFNLMVDITIILKYILHLSLYFFLPYIKKKTKKYLNTILNRVCLF